ncbi:E3 ubiquitin-protein ligase RNF180 isoform X1 [Syngnathus acus]|uniref:E3 ubiquitin-protein ligase RNF180 isoform X1 n=2 Tax=Syngnathus acus TaxID=161584 RepID=UPI001885E065|nr:E3 ubiquitin-protein ligase RNF180 isoform X1 [Syngnathus acus]XP_037122316.1 E3 ubiquitin-protein ligase RNF180 isoform X1 [Syngnathus acus]
MLRCRKCRKVVIECLQEVEVTDESSEVACTIWHMNVDTLPEWIRNSLHLAQWTAGRLECQNCGARLGGFNFIRCSQCPCGRDATIHLSKCRVDHDHKQSLFQVQPRWSRPDKRPQMTEGSEYKYESLELNKSNRLQLNTVDHMPLPDLGVSSQVMSEDSPDGSMLSPILCPMTKDDDATFSAVTSSSSVSALRQAPLECQIQAPQECQMVQTEENEGSSAENAHEDISLSLRRTPFSNSSAEQEEEIVPGSSLASTSLHRQNKREKNHLKSQRRKQRRREKWLQKQASNLKDLMLNGEEAEEEDRQGLTCAVCLDIYFRPYSCQPCSHVFCEPCLRKLAKNREENTPCPLCRALISHTKFHTELSQKAESSFPRVYRARKQYFQNASCVKWPLPSCRKAFCNWWGYRRNAERAHTSWHFAHAFTLQTFHLSDVCGWFFDIVLAMVYTPYPAIWMLTFLFLAMSMYYLCI